MQKHGLRSKSKPNLFIGQAAEDFLDTLPHEHFYELPTARPSVSNANQEINTNQQEIIQPQPTLHSFGSLNTKSKKSLVQLKKSLQRCLLQASEEERELQTISGSKTDRLCQTNRFGLNYSTDKTNGHYHRTINLTKFKENEAKEVKDTTEKSNNNQRLIIRRTIREICQCSLKLNHRSPLINYEQFVAFLNEMKLLSSNSEAIVRSIWDRINVEEELSIRRLLNLCCQIYTVFDQRVVGEVAKEAGGLFSQNVEVEWPAYQKIRDHMASKLDKLYANKLNYDKGRERKQMLEDVKENQFTFRPEISERTRKLANKNKSREECKGEGHLSEVLKNKTQNVGRHVLQKKQLNEQQEKDFPFKPRLSRPAVSSWKPKAGNVEKEIVRILNARCQKGTKKQVKREGTRQQDVVKIDIYIDKEQKHELIFDESVEVEEVIRRFSNRFDISTEAKTRLSQMIISELRTSLLP